jgi:translation initiation factor 1
VVRVRREVKGRRGKTVTLITGVPLPEIQGDHRDALVAELEGRGYSVKRAGG